ELERHAGSAALGHGYRADAENTIVQEGQRATADAVAVGPASVRHLGDRAADGVVRPHEGRYPIPAVLVRRGSDRHTDARGRGQRPAPVPPVQRLGEADLRPWTDQARAQRPLVT